MKIHPLAFFIFAMLLPRLHGAEDIATVAKPWAFWRCNPDAGVTNGQPVSAWVDAVNKRVFAPVDPERLPVWRTANEPRQRVLLPGTGAPVLHFADNTVRRSLMTKLPGSDAQTVVVVLRVEPSADGPARSGPYSALAFRRPVDGGGFRSLALSHNGNPATGENQWDSLANGTSPLRVADDNQFFHVLTIRWTSPSQATLRLNEDPETPVPGMAQIGDQGALTEMVLGGYADTAIGFNAACIEVGSVLVYDRSLGEEESSKVRRALYDAYGICHTTRLMPQEDKELHNFILEPLPPVKKKGLILWCHGAGELRQSLLVVPVFAPAVEALLRDGWVIGSSFLAMSDAA